MERKPVQKVVGEWQHIVEAADSEESANIYALKALRVIVTREPKIGWHLSISHPGRYPSWDEIVHAREKLLPDELTFVMFLPPKSQYVNLGTEGRGNHVFHLHEFHDEEADNADELHG